MGCGSDSNPSAPTYAGDAAASCPVIAGTFTIQKHCSAALIGTTIAVEQTACDFTTTGAFPGFHGTLDREGKFTMVGTSNGTEVSCTGTASADRIDESCTGSCQVTLTR